MSDDKTHAPTEKKLEDARKKGDVVTAAEARHAVMFVGALAVLLMLGTWTASRLGVLLTGMWGHSEDVAITPAGAQHLASALMAQAAMTVLPMLGVLFAFALLTMFSSGKPRLATDRLKLKWDKLSPMAGAKRLFGMRALVEFAKTFAKLVMVIVVVGWMVWPRIAGLDTLIGAPAATIGAAATGLVLAMVKAAALLVVVIAAADYLYQRRSFMKRMMMSFQEIKDEHKQSEGDPKIKGKIRQIQMQRSRQRMMAKVPEASVIVVNPTHYAVALQYDHGAMAAPVVVAKGVDAVALNIREVATRANVPIVESPPLARALYATVELDHPIKPEHYTAVAEIVSFVMKLGKKG
jgi:flagellar biosynthetic protein FlhB